MGRLTQSILVIGVQMQVAMAKAVNPMMALLVMMLHTIHRTKEATNAMGATICEVFSLGSGSRISQKSFEEPGLPLIGDVGCFSNTVFG